MTVDTDNEHAAALEEARRSIDDALALARPPWPFAALHAAQDEIERHATALEKIRANLDRSLVILLLGGTGVGKSSMLNALAGREIARTSSVRPCTSSATFYAASADEIDDLRETVERDDYRIEGAGDSLRGKVIVDPPDFDSSERENRLKLLRLLEVADLVVVVANRVKYRQASLFELLGRFRGAKTFAFVLNMCDDPLFGDEVVEDWRGALSEAGFDDPRTFVVSALRAAEAKAGGLAPDAEAGDFAALEAMTHRELEAQRIAEIKRVNLEGARRELLATLQRLTPDPDALDQSAWGGDYDRIATQAQRALVRELRIALFDRGPDLASFMQEQRLRRIEGTFGIFAGIWNQLGRWTSMRGLAASKVAGATKKKSANGDDEASADDANESMSTGLAAAQVAVRHQLERIPRRRVKQAIESARTDARDLAARLGVRDETIDAALPEMSAREVAARPLEEASLALEDALEEALAPPPTRRAATTPPSVRIASALRAVIGPWNIAPNICLAIGGYHFLSGFLVGEVRLAMLLVGVGLAAAICAAEYAHLRRRSEEQSDALRTRLLGRADEVFARHLRSMLTEPFAAMMSDVKSAARRLHGGE